MTSSYGQPKRIPIQGQFDFGDILGRQYNQNSSLFGSRGAFALDTLATERDVQAALAMGQAQTGSLMDAFYMSFGLNQLDKGNDRAEIYDYTMRGLDKQTELQNYFTNQQYGRDIGMLAATGEQTRKNYAAQGVQNRLQTITAGEQQRLGYAALGDQNRQQARVEGDEGRKTIRTQGEEDRLLRQTEGKETRKLRRTEGKETRKLRRTEGRQERLNIAARGDQERQTYDSNDLIDARREERERSRARALARSF